MEQIDPGIVLHDLWRREKLHPEVSVCMNTLTDVLHERSRRVREVNIGLIKMLLECLRI